MSKSANFLLAIATIFLISQNANAITLGQIAQVASTATPAAFNTVEFNVPTMQDRVPQWNRVNAALSKDQAKLQSCLNDAAHCDGQAMNAWRTLVSGLQNQDDNTKLSLVNSFFNSWQYRSDDVAYGQSDYWASPLEFMANSGDCEDYAIAKYTTLKFLGFNDNQMRIVALVDNNRGGIGHAILSVATTNGKQILDNLSTYVYQDNQQTGYSPRFAVNQTGIYTYAQQPQVILASAQY